MSEEQDKFEKRKKEALKRKKQLQKQQSAKMKPSTKKKLSIFGGSALAIILIAAIVVLNAGFTRRMATAVKVGEEKVSSAEYSYYYIQQAVSTYNMYVQYFGSSYAPFDTGKSLSKQYRSDGVSWADYLSQSAISSIQSVKTLVQAARAEGFALSAEGATSVEEAMNQLSTYAQNQKMSLEQYLQKAYGKGMNTELMRGIQTDYQLAAEYETALKARPEYSEQDLEEYYQNTVKDTYTYADLHYYAFNKQDASDGTPEKTLEDARKEAEAFMNGIRSEEDYSSKVIEILTRKAQEEAAKKAEESSSENSSGNSQDNSGTTQTITDTSKKTGVSISSLKNVDEKLAEWAFAEGRAAGDLELIENENGTGYYVVYLVKTAYRQDYHTVNMRQILIQVEDTTDEEELAEAKKEAEELLEQWKGGAADEDSFAALADEESDLKNGNGGLYEQLANSGDEVSTWLFEASRKYGDTAIVQSSGGYHIVFYVGQDEPYWKVQVEASKRSEDYNQAYKELSEQYPLTEYGFGKWLRSEPFR